MPTTQCAVPEVRIRESEFRIGTGATKLLNGYTSIAENVKMVREAIAEAAIKSGRMPEDIRLVAAAKTKPADYIRHAINAGVDAVGENRVQEMQGKQLQCAYEGAPLHFIGHLQSNKVSKVVGVCDLIESVSS